MIVLIVDQIHVIIIILNNELYVLYVQISNAVA